jgi:hypothetical protein
LIQAPFFLRCDQLNNIFDLVAYIRIMLRKYMRIVFLSVFALLSSGIVATLHMCQSEIRGLEWFAGESKKCPCDKQKDMDDGCCDTLVVHFEQDDATPSSQPAVPTDSIVGELDMPHVYEIENDDFPNSSLGLQAREPVPIVPIWLSNQSLRIPDAC